jgi:hypothetical protein
VAKLSDVAHVPRGEARAALTKSLEFSEAAHAESAAKRWNAAGLAAIHAAISAADAALIASAGLRSTSQDHGAVIPLLEAQIPEFKAQQRRQLGGLLKKRNQVAYERRPLSEVEAKQLVDQATRFTRWADSIVKKQLGEQSP